MNKSTANQTLPILRNASEPFTIHLNEEPYVLTTAQLLVQATTDSLGERAWNRPFLEFISFKDKTLEFQASAFDGGFKIGVRIEPDRLDVSCNCGASVEKLCIHAFKALERIIEFKGWRYFERYQPEGMVETGLKYPKLFKRWLSNIDLHYTPKKEVGSVYYFLEDPLPASVANILALPGPSTTTLPKDNTALTYILMVPHTRLHKDPSFLLPCSGLKNKAGTDVKRFDKFLSGTEKSYEPYLTGDQKLLNKLCFDMWKQAEHTNGRLLENDERHQEKLKKLFTLWEKAVPYLRQQEFVYRHPFLQRRYLNRKPFKASMRRITFRRERPTIFFQLIDKGDYYWLCLKVVIGSRTMKQFSSEFSFFIEDGSRYYLVSSLRDAAILEWMGYMDNRLTVFKEHFEEFKDKHLNLLREHYDIEYK